MSAHPRIQPISLAARRSTAASPREVARARRRRRLVPLLLSLVTVLLLGWSASMRGGDDPADAQATAGTKAAAPTPTAAGSPVSTVSPSGSPAATAPQSATASPSSAAPGEVVATVVQVPDAGTGQLARVPVAVPAVPGAGRVVRYGVEVEGGLPFDAAEFARQVHTILTDPQGWQGVLGVRFELAAEGDVELRVALTSPSKTDQLCAPARTNGNLSCWNGSQSVINAKRWGIGAESYGSALVPYRYYLIAHEVGHGLGRSHKTCPTAGAPAPVMVQQSKSLYGCAANPFPAVTGG